MFDILGISNQFKINKSQNPCIFIIKTWTVKDILVSE